MFKIFEDKMRHIQDSTIRFYAHVICQFIIYSPSVDPNDVEGFIMFKFKLNKKSGILKSRLKGNDLNYYKCINRFLAIIYSSDFSVLCPEFSKDCVLSDNSNEHLPSVLELTNAYVDLMNKKVWRCSNSSINVLSRSKYWYNRSNDIRLYRRGVKHYIFWYKKFWICNF